MIHKDGKDIELRRTDDARRTRQLHGLNRTLLHNLIVGVDKGFEKKLTLIGVGYRAKVEGRKLHLSVGFSHSVVVELADGIDVAVTQNTHLSVTGTDKSNVGNFA